MRITEIHEAGKAHVVTVGGRTTIVLPIKVLHRSARKQIIGPAPGVDSRSAPIKLTPFQLALVRGHRWLALLESGEAGSLKDIAEREGADASLVSRLLNFTTLAPEVVDAMLEDSLNPKITLLDVAIDPPEPWHAQLRALMSS
jgi:hypothetical protein